MSAKAPTVPEIKTEIKSGILEELIKMKGYAKDVYTLTSTQLMDSSSDIMDAIKSIKEDNAYLLREIKEVKASQSK